MKQFDTTRFSRVLKLDFAEGRKAMMWGALCMLLLYLFFFWFAWNIGMHVETVNDWSAYIHGICESVSVFSLIAMYIFFLITASTLYRSEQKKQQRIAWLMLPATNLEKFLSRWVYMLAFSLLAGVLTFVLADGIHMIWLKAAGHPVLSATSFMLGNLPTTTPYFPLIAVLDIYLVYVAIHAIYLLSSVFFKKYHFIACTAFLAIAFSAIVPAINALGYRDTPHEPGYILPNILSISISVCIITLCTWLAYRLFCRWQVVTHKFANL